MTAEESPGSHVLQEKFGSSPPARAFYRSQMRDRLNPWMQEFIANQEMVFIALATARGECDCSFRADVKGFVRILDERTLAYPECRGNRAYASLGNFVENAHIGMLFVDFFRYIIGLHVNGSAAVLAYEDLVRRYDTTEDLRGDGVPTTAPRSELWVVVGIEEAYRFWHR